MPDLEDQLDRLAPAIDTDLARELFDRRRNRSQRGRRLRVMAAAAAILVVAGAGVAWLAVDRADPVDVATGPGTTSDAGPVTEFTITPSTFLRDGDVVEVLIPDADRPTVTFVAECAGEVLDLAMIDGAPDDELRQWCTSIGPATEPSSSVTIAEVIDTPNGPVDCTARSGRCLVAARIPSGMRWEYLHFADQPSAEPLTVEVDPTTAQDGMTTTVEGYGGLAGQKLQIFQCRGEKPLALDAIWPCDSVRTSEATAGADGRYRISFIVYREIFVHSASGQGGEWVACEPCTIMALRTDAPDDQATAPIAVAATADPIRPGLEVLDHQLTPNGMDLTVHGSGFQINGSATPGLCFPRADDGGSPQCSYGLRNAIEPDERGEFTVDLSYEDRAFRGLGDGPSCTSLPLPCVLGIQPGEGLGLAVSAPVPPYP